MLQLGVLVLGREHAEDGLPAICISRLGRGSDPKGPRPADARLNLRMLSEQKQRWEDAANNARLPLTDWAVRALDEAANPHAPDSKPGR